MSQSLKRTRPFTLQQEVTASALGVSALAINTAKDSEIFDVDGFNQLTLEVSYTQSAGTGVQFNLSTVNEDDTEFPLQSGSESGGTETLTDRLITKSLASGGEFAYHRPINAKRLRITNILATGSPDASDTVTIKAILGSI